MHGALLTGQAAAVAILKTLGVAVRAGDLLGGEAGLSAAEVEDWVRRCSLTLSNPR